jgi:peptidoglycan/LPS O-acetylase OafA/YrhL
VLLATLLTALLIMMPDELAALAKSLLAAALFYSNYFFMADAGYFAAPSEAKPLLHMCTSRPITRL